MLERLDETAPSTSRLLRALESARRRAEVARRAAPVFLLAAVLTPLLLFAVAAARDWRALEAEALARVVLVRDAVAEHAERVLETHRFVAFSIRDRARGMSWEAIAASEDLHLFLRRIAAELPEIEAIWLVDGEGRLRASSRAMPAEPADQSDAAWFVLARDGRAPLTLGPGDGAPREAGDGFAIATPRGGVGPRFDGVVRVALAPSYFESYYARAYPGAGGVALLDGDGSALVVHPPDAAAPLDEGALARIRAGAAEGVREGPAAAGGRPGVVAFARLDGAPIYAAVALPRADVAARWRERMAGYGLFVAPAAAALVLLGVLAWRSHRALEEQVRLRTRALSQAVAEKNQLLKEVHHRVKNNMQIVSSLIRMQERAGGSSEDTIRRVQAMALVHDLVYSHGEFASVNLGAYVRRLCETLGGAAPQRAIAFDYELDHVAIALERAMPFALILSEVVTNAMRHAFGEGGGRVRVTLRRRGPRVWLRVADDGRGFDHAAPAQGFGLQLIRKLAVQLGAETRFETGDRGAAFVMEFPLEQGAGVGAA